MNKTLQNDIARLQFSELLKLFRTITDNYKKASFFI